MQNIGAGLTTNSQTGLREGALRAMDMTQGAIMAEAAKEEERRAKKNQFGGLGSTIGGIAGAALAPVTGGSSLMMGALGSAAGGALGGQTSGSQLLKNAVAGGFAHSGVTNKLFGLGGAETAGATDAVAQDAAGTAAKELPAASPGGLHQKLNLNTRAQDAQKAAQPWKEKPQLEDALTNTPAAQAPQMASEQAPSSWNVWKSGLPSAFRNAMLSQMLMGNSGMFGNRRY